MGGFVSDITWDKSRDIFRADTTVANQAASNSVLTMMPISLLERNSQPLSWLLPRGRSGGSPEFLTSLVLP